MKKPEAIGFPLPSENGIKIEGLLDGSSVRPARDQPNSGNS
jgi:hypothetical protein